MEEIIKIEKRLQCMNRKIFTKRLPAVLLCLLVLLSTFAGCAGNNASSASSAASSQAVSSAPEDTSQAASSTPEESAAVKNISFTVVHGDGSEKVFQISTSAETLGEALLQEKLIEGETSEEYGLFVKTVDGETADEGSKQWWCLTKGGEMTTTGVDSTPIADGDAFEFTLTEG